MLIEDAKLIVSDRHACSPSEALTRLCFVSWYTKRNCSGYRLEVVTSPPAKASTNRPPPVYRFTL